MALNPPFRIIYENADVLVVEKSVGIVTHPVYKHPNGALTDFVWEWCEEHGRPKPWLVHRLDRDTSGIVLFAKTSAAMRLCAKQFANHTVRKGYQALVWGADLPDDGIIDEPLDRDPSDRRRVIVREDGQLAQTRYAVAARYADRALLWLWPLTGRTHQLRAHLVHLGHPIVGDPVYATAYPSAPRLMLHAASLDLLIPALPEPRRRTFLAPIPPDFAAALPFGS